MYILQSRLKTTNNIFYNFQSVDSFGLYWWKKLFLIFSIKKKNLHGTFNKPNNLIFLWYLVLKLFLCEDLLKATTLLYIQIKKSFKSYVGLWLTLGLPIWGQWTKTNASTQRLLLWIPWKKHFVQRRNWWKFLSKEPPVEKWVHWNFSALNKKFYPKVAWNFNNKKKNKYN